MKAFLTALALAAAAYSAAAQTNSVVTASVAPTTTTAAKPAPDAYTSAMLDAIGAQNAAKTPAEIQATLAQFERIAAAAPAAWEPLYYQTRGYIKLGFASKDGDAQDKFFDQAQAVLDRTLKMKNTDRSELLVQQAYVLQGRIMVSPMLRGAVYTGRVQEALGEAKALNPSNPRVYLVLANDLYYRPAMFGGGGEKAKPLYEKALALFAAYKPASALSPTWGLGNATSGLAKINGETAGK